MAIEGICFKFGHAVTEYDVFRWLRNFDESEWDMALHVLNMVVYYSSDRISETIEREIKELTLNYPESHIQILPSGNVGKSGHVMAYHTKKIVERLDPKQDYLKLINLKSLDSIPKNSVLVLLDDFSGTGESIKKFYENKVKDMSNKRKLTCCALTVAYMEKAEKYLFEECSIKMYGDMYLPAFAHRGSVFGYEKAMRPIRDFCFKKGEMLLPHWKELDLKPLGYKNSDRFAYRWQGEGAWAIQARHHASYSLLPEVWRKSSFSSHSSSYGLRKRMARRQNKIRIFS